LVLRVFAPSRDIDLKGNANVSHGHSNKLRVPIHVSHGHVNKLRDLIHVSHGHVNRLPDLIHVSHGHVNVLRDLVHSSPASSASHFRSAIQFETKVSGVRVLSSTGLSTRKRWPSRAASNE
jgi:hypothetical protein